MYYQHPYLDPFYQGSNMQERDAAFLAQEASWTLGNDYVSGQLNEAQRFGGIPMHDVAQRLAGEAHYVRDRHMQSYYSSATTIPTVTSYPARHESDSASSNSVSVSKPSKPTSIKKVATNSDFDDFYKKYFPKKEIKTNQSWRSFLADDDVKYAIISIPSYVIGLGLLSYFTYWLTN